LKKNKDENTKGETDFLMNTIDQIEKTVDPSSNPMDAVSGILNSGIFTDLMSNMNNGLQDGSLDLGKLMGSVQNVLASMDNGSGKPSLDISSLMNSLPKPNPTPESESE